MPIGPISPDVHYQIDHGTHVVIINGQINDLFITAAAHLDSRQTKGNIANN